MPVRAVALRRANRDYATWFSKTYVRVEFWLLRCHPVGDGRCDLRCLVGCEIYSDTDRQKCPPSPLFSGICASRNRCAYTVLTQMSDLTRHATHWRRTLITLSSLIHAARRSRTHNFGSNLFRGAARDRGLSLTGPSETGLCFVLRSA